MKILLIRGGALGDFIVTLPTMRLLRQRWPDAHIELLGYPRIADIAVARHYLDEVKSVNHGPLSAFFTPNAVLDPDWMDYFGDFDLVLSFFYDPDKLFATNLQRCNPVQLLVHSPRVPDNFEESAARYFARILQPLDLRLGADASSELFPSPEDLAGAQAFLSGLQPGTRLVAIHPGSGGENKKWRIESWAALGRKIVEAHPDVTLLLVEGEADADPARHLIAAWKDLPLQRARWLPLPILTAVLHECALFLGHDSGITHLAAAARRDLPVIALFGPTNPAVWAPPRAGVRVVKNSSMLETLGIGEVFSAVESALAK